MTPLEISGLMGAALVGGGGIVVLLSKFLGNGKNDILKEQTTVLREIRDNIIAFRHELKSQNEKLDIIYNQLRNHV